MQYSKDLRKNHVKRKTIVQVITWLVGVLFLGVAITVSVVYLMPREDGLYKFAVVIFLILLYCVAWTIRGISSDTKDTLIADMGDIELEVMKAKIEQVLKARKNGNSS
jgi:uncharacterized membrane protein